MLVLLEQSIHVVQNCHLLQTCQVIPEDCHGGCVHEKHNAVFSDKQTLRISNFAVLR